MKERRYLKPLRKRPLVIKAAYEEPIPGLYDGLVDPRKILAQRLMKISDKRKIPSLLEFSKRMKIPDLFDPTKFVFYDPKSDRAQELWLMMLDDNKYDRYVFCGPPQISGKTLVAVMVPTLRDLIERRISVGYGLPTGDDLAKSYATKLKPSLEKSGFGGYLPKAGPGARGGKAPSIRFEDFDAHELPTAPPFKPQSLMKRIKCGNTEKPTSKEWSISSRAPSQQAKRQ
jgi:hypothetical protein